MKQFLPQKWIVESENRRVGSVTFNSQRTNRILHFPTDWPFETHFVKCSPNRQIIDYLIIKLVEDKHTKTLQKSLKSKSVKWENGYNWARGAERRQGGRKRGWVSDRAFIITWLTCILLCERVIGKDTLIGQSPALKGLFISPSLLFLQSNL